MITISILKQFSRLSVSPAVKIQASTRLINTASALPFRFTEPLCAEPMKKKKRVDPAIVKAREDRRRKKLEKQIRRLEKNARQLKPIEEMEVPLHLIDEKLKRQRPAPSLPGAVLEQRALLQKAWTRYKRQEHMAAIAQMDRMLSAQRQALDRLYEQNEDLYCEAITPDLELIPYTVWGPVATPPIAAYDSPDGEYVDITRKWDH